MPIGNPTRLGHNKKDRIDTVALCRVEIQFRPPRHEKVVI